MSLIIWKVHANLAQKKQKHLFIYSDYSTCIKRTNYTASISEISRAKERMSDHKSQLTKVERTQYRGVVGHLNWVAGISRPDISFSVCGASSRCIYISTKLSGM